MPMLEELEDVDAAKVVVVHLCEEYHAGCRKLMSEVEIIQATYHGTSENVPFLYSRRRSARRIGNVSTVFPSVPNTALFTIVKSTYECMKINS